MPGVPRKGEPSSPPDLAPTAARALLAAKAEGQRTVASPMPAAPPVTGRDFPDQSLPWACLRRRPSSTCRFSIRRPSTISTQAGSSATATIGCSSRRDGIHTDDDPRLPTTRLYRRQITAFDPSATDNGDELSPVDHGMISSARTKNDWGIVSPSALAVLRLITRSNLVGCSMGRSAGLAPLRILSTNVAARRNMSV